MATTSDYLKQLQTDKNNLATKLKEKGVDASNDETFTELVPKIDNIQSGVDSLVDQMRAADIQCKYNLRNLRTYTEKDYTELEISKTQEILNKLGGI